MTAVADPVASSFFRRALGEIDHELGCLASLCRVDLLDDATVERVLRNDASACGTPNPVAFAKMRALLIMHYTVRARAAEALGAAQAQVIVDIVLYRLRTRARVALH